MYVSAILNALLVQRAIGEKYRICSDHTILASHRLMFADRRDVRGGEQARGRHTGEGEEGQEVPQGKAFVLCDPLKAAIVILTPGNSMGCRRDRPLEDRRIHGGGCKGQHAC